MFGALAGMDNLKIMPAKITNRNPLRHSCRQLLIFLLCDASIAWPL
jgi:hypothetical protein